MAKKAKKELTPEERLAAARVPKEEWPYELPEGWEWVRLGGVAEWGSGGTPSRKHPEYYEGSIPWIKTGELNDGYINETEEHITEDAIQHSSAKIFPVNTVAVAMYGATIGKVGILGVEAATNQACACGIVDETTDFKYLFYYLRSQKDAFIKKGKGGAQPNISQTVIKSHPIPLPPLEIQQRIVDHIESLFAKLDQAKEKAQQALATSETRKAAILHQSFTGQLTAQWREDNGVSMETWEEVSSDQLFEYVTSGSRGWAKYYSDQGDLFLRMGNLDHGTIKLDLSEIQHVALPLKAEGQRSKLQKNDILISITADVGMVGLVKDDIEGDAFINQHLALARPIAEHNAEFLAWYLVSDLGQRQLFKKQRGATKIGLGLDDIRSLLLKIPKIEEQQEIVRILDDLLAKEQRIQQAVETILQQIDDTKKSILAKAFRGEWQN